MVASSANKSVNNRLNILGSQLASENVEHKLGGLIVDDKNYRFIQKYDRIN